MLTSRRKKSTATVAQTGRNEARAKARAAKGPALSLEEIRKEVQMGGTRCSLAKWIETRPKAERVVFKEALMDHTITTAAIARAIKARGYERGDDAVTRHRRQGIESCRDCKGLL
jgi:hypothetical protein